MKSRMTSRFVVLTSAAVGLASLFAPLARAQRLPSPPVGAAQTRLRLKLDFRDFVRMQGSHEYGLTGLNLRFQMPSLISPYIEGRLGDGVVASRPDGALIIPGTPIGLNGAIGASWMFTRGVDLGVDVHRFKGGYLSVALGWLRSSWPIGGFDANDRRISRDVSQDAFLLKFGFSM